MSAAVNGLDARSPLSSFVVPGTAFRERYGFGRAIVLARFVPLIRAVLNPLAGIVEVPHAVVTRRQLLGGLLWTVGASTAGRGLGRTIPGIDRYLLPVTAVVVLVSLTPITLEAARDRRARG